MWLDSCCIRQRFEAEKFIKFQIFVQTSGWLDVYLEIRGDFLKKAFVNPRQRVFSRAQFRTKS